MADIFSGLDELGLGNLSNMSVYDKKEVEKTEVKKEAEITEDDFVFDKTFQCPACNQEFKSKVMKTGRVKLLSLDTDLRPKYQFVDSLKYDVVACHHCGYAALSRFFKYLSFPQIKLIKENITKNFKGLKESQSILTYDDTIARHKLALVNSIVKKGKVSERAYTCLKTAWVLRGKRETLPKDTPNYKVEIINMAKEEAAFTLKAYDGFIEAFGTETFPMCGMDEITTSILIADLARRTGNYEVASRWISKVLTSRDANERIKTRARDIKDLLQE